MSSAAISPQGARVAFRMFDRAKDELGTRLERILTYPWMQSAAQ